MNKSKMIKGYKLFCEAQMWMTRIKDIRNYVENSDMIEDIWTPMSEYTEPTFNGGNVRIEFDQIDPKDRSSRDYKIPRLNIGILLQSAEEVPNKTQSPSFDILKGHSCYQDLISCNDMMIDALGIDKKDCKIVVSCGAGNREIKKRLSIGLEYEITEAFLKSITDRLLHGDQYGDSRRYYDLLKDREDLKGHEVIRSLKKSVDRGKIESNFKDIFRDLLRYGFEYDHVLDKAKELDFGKCIDAGCHSPELFFVMSMVGKYDDIDYLRDFGPDFFFYKSSQIDSCLGYEILLPVFKRCMQSEVLWVEGESKERELALLFLLMKPSLLKSHMEDGDSRERWIEILSSSFNHVAENLIALNRKESLQWLIDLIKKEPLDKKSKRAVQEFIIDYNLHLRRIKSDFSGKVKWHEVTPVQKGKFKESPDFEFFDQKLAELKEYCPLPMAFN